MQGSPLFPGGYRREQPPDLEADKKYIKYATGFLLSPDRRELKERTQREQRLLDAEKLEHEAKRRRMDSFNALSAYGLRRERARSRVARRSSSCAVLVSANLQNSFGVVENDGVGRCFPKEPPSGCQTPHKGPQNADTDLSRTCSHNSLPPYYYAPKPLACAKFTRRIVKPRGRVHFSDTIEVEQHQDSLASTWSSTCSTSAFPLTEVQVVASSDHVFEKQKSAIGHSSCEDTSRQSSCVAEEGKSPKEIMRTTGFASVDFASLPKPSAKNSSDFPYHHLASNVRVPCPPVGKCYAKRRAPVAEAPQADSQEKRGAYLLTTQLTQTVPAGKRKTLHSRQSTKASTHSFIGIPGQRTTFYAIDNTATALRKRLIGSIPTTGTGTRARSTSYLPDIHTGTLSSADILASLVCSYNMKTAEDREARKPFCSSFVLSSVRYE